MFARQTILNIRPDKVNEAMKIYGQEIIPQVRSQRGNVDVYLLEPTDRNGEYISVTMWETRADAEQYEKSGKFNELAGKMKPLLAQPLVVKQYEVQKKFH